MSNMCDADDHWSPFPLVDLMSNEPPSDIGTGEMEMVSLVDEIEAAITAAALARPRAAVGERDGDVGLAEAARDLLDAQKRLGPAVAFRLDLWACLEAILKDRP